MKKGFTLVELIAVIAILGLIALVVYPAVSSVIRNSKESACMDQVAVIENAAKSWSLKNTDELSYDKAYELDIDVLVDEGYLSNDEIIDPRTSKKMEGVVTITYENKQFIFNGKELCR